MLGRYLRHEAELAFLRSSLSHAEPLVHIHVHGGIVDARNLVVAHKVHSQQAPPCAGVGIQVHGRVIARKALRACTAP